MLNRVYLARRAQGTTIIEVLVSIVIISFGLLGLAAFQLRSHAAELESLQRAQALVLLSDMASRMQANRANAGDYVGTMLGTGVADCTGAAGTAAFDRCEWNGLLKGSAEQTGSTKLGAMVGARGCITLVQSPVLTAGACSPGIYEVSVAWQGLHSTVAPLNTCGSGSYGNDDTLRRLVSMRIAVAPLGCS